MKKLSAALLLGFCFAPLYAQDVNPLDSTQILQELQDIQAKSEASAIGRQKQRVDLVLKASGSKEAALAFYEDAQRATQFQGANQENAQFREWKKKQEEQLKDAGFRESIRLHLYYLGLSLKKAGGAKPEEMVPKVVEYLATLDASQEAVEVKGSLLKESVAGGIFAKWLGLEPELAQAKDWEMNPGNYDQIAVKYLLPEWRKQKSPAILTYWDGRIRREGAAAGSAKLDFEENTFANIRKPELLWQRAQELPNLGQPNRAAQEMFGLIKTHPNHPEVGNWISQLQKLLDPKKV